MESKELRIGNYLLTTSGLQVEVEFIHSKHFDCRELGTGLFIPNGEYKPAPITEDWLLRLGFEKYKVSKSFGNTFILKYKNTIFKVCNKGGSDNFIGVFYLKTQIHTFPISDIDVKYIHQLQNLYFAITKKELLIKA